jgi:hypothetical protein
MVTPCVFGHIHSRRPLWLRSLALGIALLQPAATGPFLWAAPALNADAIQVLPAVSPATTKGPEPDASVLALQGSLVTGLSPAAAPPQVAPIQRMGSRDAAAPAKFTRPMLTNMGVLSASAAPMGATSETEDTALGHVLFELRLKKGAERIDGLRQFAKQNPNSPWRAAVLGILGRLESEHGYFTRATVHLREAWDAAKQGGEPLQRVMASDIAGDLALVLARSSRDAAFTDLMQELAGKMGYGTSRQRLIIAKRMVADRQKGIANVDGGCAVAALRAWSTVLNPTQRPPKLLLDSKERQRRGIEPRANEPTSMKELAQLAQAIGWRTVKSKRASSGPIPVPSIVHWKHGHFALVLARNGQEYLVEDRSLGGRVTMTEEALNEETSGYLLGFGTKPVSGATIVSDEEAGEVRGFTGGGDGEVPTDTCEECEEAKNCSASCGMPRYWIDKLEATLRFADMPLFDDPGVGPALDLSLRYADRQEHNLNNDFPLTSNVGRLWSLKLLSAVVPRSGGWIVDGEPGSITFLDTPKKTPSTLPGSALGETLPCSTAVPCNPAARRLAAGSRGQCESTNGQDSFRDTCSARGAVCHWAVGRRQRICPVHKRRDEIHFRHRYHIPPNGVSCRPERPVLLDKDRASQRSANYI